MYVAGFLARNRNFFDNKTRMHSFGKAPARPFDVRGHLFWLEACMSRDDLLFWLSIAWFAALPGALVWAFVAL
jgi:hypothetical protein